MSATSGSFPATDRFVLRRRIGEGAFGVVYEAFDRERQLVVALKTLRQTSADALYHFKREFRALADLSHPNLVALYELLTEGEQWFFTMEFVSGVDFVTCIRDPPPPGAELPPPRTQPSVLTATQDPGPSIDASAATQTWASTEGPRKGESSIREPPAPAAPPEPYRGRLTDALAQLTAGLGALHDAGKLHRDIKPSNVLVTPDGRVVLLDFGLVTEVGRYGAHAGADALIVGTPAYMSPEQSAGRPVSEATDWYGVGVMLYEVLTGRVPFSGAFAAILDQKQRAELLAPAALVPGIQEDLSALCQELLRPNPLGRAGRREVLDCLASLRGESLPGAMRPAVGIGVQPLVGRDRHLEALRAAFIDAKAGRSVTVYVHGESGMGKSALVRGFLDEVVASGSDAVVLTGRCYEQESVPYKALDQLIDGLSQFLRRLPPSEAETLLPGDVLALSRLFPVLRRVEALAGARRRVLDIPDPQELRRRAFGALRELLARVAGQWPLILFIDDLQWGDVDSAPLLAELVRPPDPPPLLLIGSYRSAEASTSPLLHALLRLRDTAEWGAEVREVMVGELTAADTQALVRTLLGPDDRDLVVKADAIARESAGNPFFINEVVRYVQDRQAPGYTGTIGLDAVVRARVSQLPPAAARLLNVVALAGRPLHVDVAKRAADLLPQDEAVLGVLRVGRLVRTRETQAQDEVETYHDRIRETVVTGLAGGVRKALHARLAAALITSGRADPEALATHFHGAGDSERAAVHAAEAAAQAAEALAFDRAARLYRLALELHPPGDPRDMVLRVKLAAALANAGRGRDAAENYLRAAEGASRDEFLDLQRRAAEQLLISGHVDEGLRALRTALGTIGMRLAGSPRRALASLLARRAYIRLRGLGFRECPEKDISPQTLVRIDSCWSVAVGLAYIDNFRAADFQARHLILALRAGEPYRVARALAMEGGYSATGGRRSARRTESILDASSQLAERLAHPHAIALVTLTSGIAASLEGRWKRALELCDRADRILRDDCTGVAWERDTAALTSLNALIYLGRLNELSQRLPAVQKNAQERGDLYASTFLPTRISYASRLAADQPERARREAREGIARWSQQGFQLQHYWTLLTEADITLYEGDGPAAWRLMTTQWSALDRSLLLRVQYALLEALDRRSRSALAAAARVPKSDREALLRSAERDARRMEREQTPWGDGLAKLVRAGVAVARGNVDRARTWLTSAERGFVAADMALHAAAARWRRGQLIGGPEGRALVQDAETGMAAERITNPASLVGMLSPNPSGAAE